MTPSMPSAVNSFSANPSGPDYLSGRFRPARAVSPPCRTQTVIGPVMEQKSVSAEGESPDPVLLLSRNDAARFGGSWWNLVSLRTVATIAEQGIDHVTTIFEAVFALEALGLQQTAKRVAHLDSLCREDPDEPDIDLESLKRLVRVMQANPAWGEPTLALAGEKNCIHAEWAVVGGGRVTISFLPSDRVDYTASSATVMDDDALDIAGRHLEGEAIQNLRWFTDRIIA